ncbi:MAG: Flp1 family type IVb pilin [Saccharofermentanales bacterium]
MGMKSENFFGQSLAEGYRRKRSSGNSRSNVVSSVKSRKGFGTVEIVLIIAVLISLALLFRSSITSYAKHLMTSVFTDNESVDIISGENADE